MKITGLHICFEVASVKRAMKFYAPLTEAAGFTASFGDGKNHMGWRNENIMLAIGTAKPRRVTRKRPTGKEFVVSDHLGLSVPSRGDVDKIDKALKKAGFKPLFAAQEYPEFGPGFYAVTFRDADNNIIEFCTRPTGGKKKTA
jgi:predicted lactoylglutathione lyase